MTMEIEKGKMNFEREETVQALRELLVKAYDENSLETHEKIINKSDRLKANYGKEVYRYRLYHLLIGSTPGENVDLFDFPEEDSIEKYIKEELVEPRK